MKDISTYLLIKELKEASSVKSYLKRYKDDLNSMNFSEYINYLLIEKNLKKSQVIKDSFIHRTYGYQLFSGIKKPSRNKVLMLAFGFHLKFDEAQRLLAYGKVSKLYPKDKRDALITFSLMNNYDVNKTNDMLFDSNENIIE